MKFTVFSMILFLAVAFNVKAGAGSIYDFTVKNIAGEEVSLSNYKDKTLLIVNVASKCGFTSQYAALQKLYEDYQDQGFEILAFPCNQFANQEPGTNEEIVEFCTANFGVTFPLFDKIDVRGEDAHPLYQFLISEKGFEGYDLSNPKAEMIQGVLEKNFPETLEGDSIKWNFTKFLINKDGKVIARFESPVEPKDIREELENNL